MLSSFTSLALFGLVAVNAAPMAQQGYQAQPTAETTNYSALWASQLASMASVQSAMAAGAASAAPAPTPAGAYPPSQPPAATGGAYTPQQPASQPAYTQPAPSQQAYSPPAASQQAPAYTSPAAVASPSPSPVSGGSTGGSTGGSGSGATVTNPKAFSNGAACKSVNPSEGLSSVHDGSYNCYPKGGGVAGPDSFPKPEQWGSFEALWTDNVPLMKTSCTNLQMGADPTDEQIAMMKKAITTVSGDSFVDPRFILAVMMQESHGCINVGTTSNGVSNPGLMQSHNGVSFDASDAENSILQMIRDGVQGTSSGDGLVQLINAHGDCWSAARCYNSGSIAADGNLNSANGATASYVTDIANRLTGWSMDPGTSGTC